jgi:acyl-[acyl-carrier-protein]-phospholipid O-acyltransferase/long-chain-fatty-acid--[acyl-carrier-protein] ligase
MDSPNQAPQEEAPLPFKNRSFLSFLCTQALGVFNDNVFKQLVLLLCVGHLFAGLDFQMVVQFLFAIPFLIFSGLAGDIADRYSKGWVMVMCKMAEIVVMLGGLAVFFMMGSPEGHGFYLWLLAALTFLMGTHSAFFGPPKYAGLPQLVRKEDLSMATGMTQMTTFFAIVFGFATAGLLADQFGGKLYIAGLFAVGIAILGTLASLGIARKPATDPQRKISVSSCFSVVGTLRRINKEDPLMMNVMLLYSWFWLVGAVALTAINSYGLFQLGLSNFEPSQMVSIVSIGIAVGSLIVGRLSKKKVRLSLIIPGLVGLVVCLLALMLVPGHHATAEEIRVVTEARNSGGPAEALALIPQASVSVRVFAFSVFFFLGFFTGFFTVPLLAFIQARPTDSEKGKSFAAANWLSWVFIVAASGFYGFGMYLCGAQAHLLLAVMGVLTLLVGLWLMPPIFRRVREEKPDFVYLEEKKGS